MHAWIDISAGVAGDMLLGALLDAGADAEAVGRAIDAVAPGSVRLETEPVTRGGQRATKARVRMLVDDPPHRTWRTIRGTLAEAPLDDVTRQRALAVFARLAAAEARAHGIDPEDVHFHEVGALDSIADVVGSCEALRTLGVDTVSASPVRLGSGRVRAAHGDIPVPVPAVAELSVGWQVYATPERDEGGSHSHDHHHDDDHDHHHDDDHHHDADHGHRHDHPHTHATPGHIVGMRICGPGNTSASQQCDQEGVDSPAATTTRGSVGELATPTGMALVRALAESCEPLPAMTVSAVGIGAGGKEFEGWPNVVRVIFGEAGAAASTRADTTQTDTNHANTTPTGTATRATSQGDFPALDLTEIRANVDDMDPRLWPGVIRALLDAGAADAWLVPILMKKGRPAFTVHALAGADAHDAVVEVLFTHTTTLGVREHPVSRTVLERSWHDVAIGGASVSVKVGARDGVVVHATPEFDSLAAAASELGVPQAEVTHRAAAAIAGAGLAAGAPVPPSATDGHD